ncbi:MAG: transposase [[Ruminococcus] lactaris]
MRIKIWFSEIIRLHGADKKQTEFVVLGGFCWVFFLGFWGFFFLGGGWVFWFFFCFFWGGGGRFFFFKKKKKKKRKKRINGRKRKGKNQNDPMRFVKKTSVTPDGEIANKQVYNIDEEQIQKEEMYDGFYAVITNLEGDVSEIIRINKQRWEIEENFRIMKTEFEARPVYVRREERIKAHFMTCYISLLLYRLLEKKLGDAYTVSQILGTLRSMQMTLLNTASGYIPSYTRTELTDSLHKTFGFRTDYEFITKASMRTIIKETKQIKSKKS